jgi:ubiquinol-cytochrome c reductase cytochrome b subunit
LTVETTATAAAPAANSDELPPSNGMKLTNWASNYIDERTSISGLVKELGRKIFPDHWSFMLGEVALYSFIVILLSGSFLTFFFQPS